MSEYYPNQPNKPGSFWRRLIDDLRRDLKWALDLNDDKNQEDLGLKTPVNVKRMEVGLGIKGDGCYSREDLDQQKINEKDADDLKFVGAALVGVVVEKIETYIPALPHEPSYRDRVLSEKIRHGL